MSHRPMTEIERQCEHLRKIGDLKMPCPNCNQAGNWWQVSQVKREEYIGNSLPDGPCPHCGAILRHAVPFIGPQYQWIKITEEPTQKPLLSGKRFVYYIPGYQAPDPKRGYIPAIVLEDEPGYWLMTGDPAKLHESWYWGDLATARKIAADRNAKMGYSDTDVARIILASMAAALPSHTS